MGKRKSEMEWSEDHKVSKEEVIAKLKDDGDFDRLRRKIIQKLKQNEELREKIGSVVKQSAALNREGAENMKPRQLSDGIYQEVGDQVMSHISDGLWSIIRSSDGMKSEITETVQSVYMKLTNPRGEADVEASTCDVPAKKEPDNKGVVVAAANVVGEMMSDNEPKLPPGFPFSSNHENNKNDELQLPLPHETGETEEEDQKTHQLPFSGELDGDDHRLALGFPTDMEHKPACDGSDEDPDVPPGFG